MIENESSSIGLSSSSSSTNTTNTNISGSGIPTTATSSSVGSVSSNSSRKNSMSSSGQNSPSIGINNKPITIGVNKSDSRNSSIVYNKNVKQHSQQQQQQEQQQSNKNLKRIKKQNKKNRTNSQKFWKSIGFVLQFIGLASIIFTIFIGLYMDEYINWSYWVLFIPVYFILITSYLATGSRILSNLVSWIMRLVWRLTVIGITVFVIFTIIRLKYSLFNYSVMMIPLLFSFGSTFLLGLYSLLYGILFVDAEITPQRKTKYIVNGLPLLFVGSILTPAAIMIALKLDNIYNAKLAVCFVSLFIGDIIASCFSFFLLLFSLGSKDTATFSIGQLLSIIFITICSIVFKVLLILNIDQGHTINFLFLLIPLLVAELFIVFCGVNLFIRPPKTQYLDGNNISKEEDSKLIVNDDIENQTNYDDADDDDDEDDDDEEEDYLNKSKNGDESSSSSENETEVSFKDSRDEKERLLK